jgi:hypothetical protein
MRHALAVIEASRPRALAMAHRRDGRLVPMKVRPNVGAAPTAGLADETWLEIGEPDVIRPLIRADRGRMAAPGNFDSRQADRARRRSADLEEVGERRDKSKPKG